MRAAEPVADDFAHPLISYFFATRPAFLLASVVPCFIGLATAHFTGIQINYLTAALTIIGAIVFHAGTNVLNDYYDFLNGTDAINKERLYPFTGGSRFIQNGVLTPVQTLRFGIVMFAAGAVIGLALLHWTGPGLLAVGLAGATIGWSYSAPPFALHSRGWGEISVGVGFGVLIPLGADLVQRGSVTPTVLEASLPYALLATCLLYINQFPDRRADEATGKRHWVVRLGVARARWIYPILVGAAYGWLVVSVWLGLLPAYALFGLSSMPFSLAAAVTLVRHAAAPDRLVPAIRQTIAAALLGGLTLSLGLFLA